MYFKCKKKDQRALKCNDEKTHVEFSNNKINHEIYTRFILKKNTLFKNFTFIFLPSNHCFFARSNKI